MHHAFPRVPFYNLEVAHKRFQELFGQPGVRPLEQAEHYFTTSLKLAFKPQVIGSEDPENQMGRRKMIYL